MDFLFIDICIFQGISWAEIYIRSWLVKKVFRPMNIDFAFKALRKIVIFRYGRFEFEAVSDKWLHKMEEEEECKKPRK